MGWPMWWWFIAYVWALPIDAVPNPRNHGSWVADVAQALTTEQEDRLDARIDALHDDLGVEIAVVVVPRTDNTPKAFATALFNRWGIGSADANNGLLVLLAIEQRRIEMETGYGLEGVLPDGWLGRMQRDVMVPALRGGNVGEALDDGLASIDARLRARPDDAAEGTRGPVAAQRARTAENSAPLWVLGGLAGGGTLLFGGAFLLARRNSRRRYCGACGEVMRKLSEAEEDEHLDALSQLEESMGNVEHSVWLCACGAVHREAAMTTFGNGIGCPSCTGVTVHSLSHVVVPATQAAEGERQDRNTCQHCGHAWTSTTVLPRIIPTPVTNTTGAYDSGFGGGGFGGGGGFSGGGGFGGGMSGGGGAGSSW